MSLIGREEEHHILQQLFNSKKPEFLAIYGRRRVGKTYLIRNFFKTKKCVFFNVNGSKSGALREQIGHFAEQIGEAFFHGVVPKAGKIGMKCLKY